MKANKKNTVEVRAKIRYKKALDKLDCLINSMSSDELCAMLTDKYGFEFLEMGKSETRCYTEEKEVFVDYDENSSFNSLDNSSYFEVA